MEKTKNCCEKIYSNINFLKREISLEPGAERPEKKENVSLVKK